MSVVSSKEWIELVAPDEEEKDPRFSAQIDKLSVIGLRVIAIVCFSGVLYFTLTGLLLSSEVRTKIGGYLVPVGVSALGAIALAASFWPRAKRNARGVGLVVGYGVAVTQFWGTASIVDRPEVGYFLFSGLVTGVMLIGIAALPLKPLQVFALGGAIAVTYALSAPWVVPSYGGLDIELLFVGQVVILCTGLTMVVYRQRVLAYRARRSAREALEELRSVQARLLVSENAHAQSRFAAALSHELNTPLGALTSAFDTLLGLCRKEGFPEHDYYADIVAGAERAGRGSAARLQETVARMSFLTNLDRAEEQTADLNELCRETAVAIRSDLEEKAELDFDFEPLPALRCRPQPLSAVLSNLLRNAAAAIETRGRISVRTRAQQREIVVEIEDDGRGIAREQLSRLFEPSFEVAGGRVAATNWGLFVCRTIVVEHGGRLEIESTEGKGTTARIALPLEVPKKSG